MVGSAAEELDCGSCVVADCYRYHFVFSHKTQQIFFLHHLVIGLSLDIGLHQDYQPLNFPMRPKPLPPSAQDQRERQRAFLGCYYLASMYVSTPIT